MTAPRVSAREAPRDERELVVRARDLEGASLADLAGGLAGGLHQKGKIGEAVERALGATAGSGAVHDFPELGVELKTIPVTKSGIPHESTFVCAVKVADAEHLDWQTSWARRKLARVLWVPVVGPKRGDPAERRIGAPLLWSPTAGQERVLQADFDDIVGLIGVGRVEDVTAHLGRWLQLRPKAANGRVRTVAFAMDGDVVETVPRGFYLRPSFTGAILRDPAAEPRSVSDGG
jgi:DNA mismatch repair protein MutH